MRRGALRVALGGILAAACGGPAQVRYEESLARTPAPAEHAVHSQRLAEVMRGLERLQIERLPQALDVEAERAARAQILAEVALAMASSAEQISRATRDERLDAAERRAFRRGAEELRTRSERLARDATRLSAPEIRLQVEAIEATCEQCHRRFRSGAGATAPQ